MKHLHYFFKGASLFLCQLIVYTSFAQVGVQWEKGTPDVAIQDIIATSDDNYLLVGHYVYFGAYDYRIIKIDHQGNKLWEKTYRGSAQDQLYAAVTTADGGYLLGGASNSYISGDKSQGSRGDFDYWVIKVDADGNKEWDKTFGGSESDRLESIVPTPDGGYLLSGTSRSGDSYEKSQPSRDIDGPSGYDAGDYWIVRIDASGNKVWDRTFGGGAREELEHVVADENGHYLLVGTSTSDVSGDKSEPNNSPTREGYWVVQVDDEGNKQWDRALGGPFMSVARTAIATADGGYIVAGYYTPPSIYPPFNELGTVDHKIFKLNATGNIVWEVNRGGNYDDVPTDIIATTDGHYLVVGYSNSDASGAKSEGILGVDETSGGGTRPSDTWIYKMTKEGKKLWDKTLPGVRNVFAVNAPDQSYILAGYLLQNIRETEVAISGFRLVNAETGRDIGWLYDKDLLELDELGNPKMNIRAIPTPLKVDSIVFKLTGPVAHQSIERHWPYALFGDEPGENGRSYLGKKLRVGNRYVLTAIPYLNGYAGNKKVIEFRVTQEFVVDKLEIFNYGPEHGDELTEGMTLQSGFSILAKFNPKNIPGVSVKFELSGPQNHTQTENGVPFALFGDFKGYHMDATPNLEALPSGEYTLKVTPYLFGEAGTETTVSFTVGTPEEATAARISSVEVFPVPSTGVLQLKYENIDNATLQVVDFTGNTVLSRPLSSQPSETLDLTSFKKGIYYLKVVSQQGIATKRVVIE